MRVFGRLCKSLYVVNNTCIIQGILSDFQGLGFDSFDLFASYSFIRHSLPL